MNKNIKNCTYAILVIGILLTGLTNIVSAETPKFLSFPFTDSDIKLQQGWVYDYSSKDHQGIDYIKGTVDKSSTWKAFDVKAAADGQAYYTKSSSWGNYVKIKHTVGTDTYYTLYAHLSSSPLPANKWVPVMRGVKIGVAGKTGAANNVIHLHFEFSKTNTGSGYRLDPYDIYSTKKNYPPYKPDGPNDYWGNIPSLVRVVGQEKVYHIDNNKNKAWIPTANVFNSWSWSWSDIKDVSQEKLNSYPDSSLGTILFKDGTFISYNGEISIIENGLRHPFANWQAYLNHGGNLNPKVYEVNAFEYSLNALGSTYYS